MIRKIAAMAAGVAVAGALGLSSPAALAAPAHAHAARSSAGQERAWVAQQVRGLLKYNPGAVQISANAVRYKGAILGIGAPGQNPRIPGSVSGVCPNDWLCLFQNINFNVNSGQFSGAWIDFYDCNVNYNLYNYILPSGGGTWANQTSSIDYPGSSDGHEAKFNHDGDWWLYLYRDHYLRNLLLNGGPNPQHNSNDWITGLYVC